MNIYTIFFIQRIQIYSVLMKVSNRFGSIWLIEHKVMAGNFNVVNGKWLDATIIRVELLLYRNQKCATNILQKIKLKIRIDPQQILNVEEKNHIIILLGPKKNYSYLIAGTWPFCTYFNPEMLETPRYSSTVFNRHFLKISFRTVCLSALILSNYFMLWKADN